MNKILYNFLPFCMFNIDFLFDFIKVKNVSKQLTFDLHSRNHAKCTLLHITSISVFLEI